MSKTSTSQGNAIDRRTFMRRTGGIVAQAGLAGGALAGLLTVTRREDAPPGARADLGIVRPPGAPAEREHLAKCIRCTRCADACEAQCIKFFDASAGSLQGTPYIVPLEKGCTMCLKCGEACPTGALAPVAEKKDVKLGTAVVDERLCVSINGTGICGACHTACPFRNKAIVQDFRNRPTVHADACTGCGLCEESCIVDERTNIRAIQVKTDRRWEHGAG